MDDVYTAFGDELMEGQDFTEHVTGMKDTSNGNSWHSRISVESYMWLLVIGSLAGLWLLAGSFRKVLS